MQAKGTEEALRELERASSEHLAWLKRVHCSLLFRAADDLPPPALELPIADDQAPGMRSRVRARLQRARCRMQALADALIDVAGHGRGVDQQDYLTFMASVEDYDREVRRLESLLRRQVAETDPLTGVHNRQGMDRELAREWAHVRKTGEPCSVALLDLDHFKAVNDTHGHMAGDRVLSTTASFFVGRLRPYDLVYRFGGEEFLFLLPNTDLDQARAILDRLRGLMARLPVEISPGKRIRVSASIGVAELTKQGGPEAAIAAADAALYRSKAAGRNRVTIASEAEIH